MSQKTISVLVVEDDKYITKAYQTKFESEGFEVKFAMSYDEAFEVLEEFAPDVIVLDIVMSDGNGYDVLERLGGNKVWSKIPVIMATNLDQDVSVRKARLLGANEYVVKSGLSLVDLVNRINEIKNEIIVT